MLAGLAGALHKQHLTEHAYFGHCTGLEAHRLLISHQPQHTCNAAPGACCAVFGPHHARSTLHQWPDSGVLDRLRTQELKNIRRLSHEVLLQRSDVETFLVSSLKQVAVLTPAGWVTVLLKSLLAHDVAKGTCCLVGCAYARVTAGSA